MSDIEKGSRHISGDAPMASGLHAPTFTQNIPSSLRVLGNPGPLGLYSFASTTFILSMYNVHARGVQAPNAVVGMALGVGGLAQLLAGMWEFACGNTFGATAFSSYGGFWLSFASILIPGTGIGAAYTTAVEEDNALGIYLASWVIITFLFLLASLRNSVGMIALFFFLDLTFVLLMTADFTGNASIAKAGGGFGILTAFIAYYCGTAQLLTKDNAGFTIPIGSLKRRD